MFIQVEKTRDIKQCDNNKNGSALQWFKLKHFSWLLFNTLWRASETGSTSSGSGVLSTVAIQVFVCTSSLVWLDLVFSEKIMKVLKVMV